jgi:NAD(P)-dependent dehydrogenase (short-subunit alcohol dehydrogenase family)
MSGSNMFDLSGKISVITGAGSGLGRAFCEAMAESGSDVVCVDIDKNLADETAEIISQHQVKVLAVEGDVSNQEDVEGIFRAVGLEFGKLDVLINNAGISTKSTPLHEMPLESWNRVINVNLTAVFLCMKEGIKLMLPQKKGSIINISSVSGLRGTGAKGPYSASKGGVIALTKSAAVDYGPYNIRVNTIAPGVVKGTGLPYSTGMGKEEVERFYARGASEAPLGRVADPFELKGLAIYLASDASSFITGAVFVAAGGSYR